jgi:hypothetical protein
MKLRHSFVSNSSTTSFVIIARRASLKEIDDPNVKIYLGEYGDGAAYDRPSEAIIAWIKAEKRDDLDFYYEYLSAGEEQEVEGSDLVSKLALLALDPKKVVIKTFEKSYYFPEDVEQFKGVVER